MDLVRQLEYLSRQKVPKELDYSSVMQHVFPGAQVTKSSHSRKDSGFSSANSAPGTPSGRKGPPLSAVVPIMQNENVVYPLNILAKAKSDKRNAIGFFHWNIFSKDKSSKRSRKNNIPWWMWIMCIHLPCDCDCGCDCYSYRYSDCGCDCDCDAA